MIGPWEEKRQLKVSAMCQDLKPAIPLSMTISGTA